VVVSRAEEDVPVSAALEHPIGPNTIEDWLVADQPEDGSRLELIWGYYYVSPAPSMQHQFAGGEVRELLKYTFLRAGRSELYVVTAVAAEISAPMRTGLIPDVLVIDIRPVGPSAKAKNVLLAVEIWSPGNVRSERESKVAAYATAGVPFFWVVNQDKLGGVAVTAYRLENGHYVEELTAHPGEEVTIKAAPEPVTFDPAVLSP
jgi:Uma2 family endonuclease